MPYFKNNILEKFVFTYEFDFNDDQLINFFLEHYNSLNSFCTKLSKNKSYLYIEIIKCN